MSVTPQTMARKERRVLKPTLTNNHAKERQQLNKGKYYEIY